MPYFNASQLGINLIYVRKWRFFLLHFDIFA